MKRTLRQVVSILSLTIFLVTGLLYAFQDNLIYFPFGYSEQELERLREGSTPLAVELSFGRQTAYFIGPEQPDALWFVFYGNASRAIGWLDFARNFPDTNTSFLLFEYPGFGVSEGKPSPSTALEAQQALFAEAARIFGWEKEGLLKKSGVLGVSLGSGFALQFAAENTVKRLVLLAPFTSLLDMAGLRFGWPLKYLLRHRLDNEGNLARLHESDPLPQGAILHGISDRTIPVNMGRTLAEPWQATIRFLEFSDCGHNDLRWKHEEVIIAEMLRMQKPL